MMDNNVNCLEERLLDGEIKKMEKDFAVLEKDKPLVATGLIVYNGIPDKFYSAINDVQEEYKLAVAKHHDFPSAVADALCIIAEEFGETAQALNDGNRQQVRVELMHTIVTAIRLLEQLN